ncbi:hypothetical protein AB0O34_34450 [Sphaerisporangium sp. NPDC088356]|uniref:hypothetical protein n=1 Tax=Sphaerisporangium sp. NPDC088356 TaxID=3154871 RepID=UPI00343F31B3
MVALLWADEAITERLDSLSLASKPLEYSEAWRTGTWKKQEAQLAVIVDAGVIRWLGRAVRGNRISSVDFLVAVREIVGIDATSLTEVTRQLPPRHTEVLAVKGVLPPAGGVALVAALKALHPDYAGLIDHLSRPLPYELPSGEPGELLNQQRDAAGILLDIGGMERGVLRSWNGHSAEVPFLSGVPRRAALEEALISHDIGRFSTWMHIPAVDVEWRCFTNGRRKMFIMNANCTPVEHSLGVDLVYYSPEASSFTMIQYKKMRPYKNRMRAQLLYRPDGNIEEELDRMKRVDDFCLQQSGEFRLFSAPCWVKLCDPRPRLDDPAELIKGIYLPRAYFQELLGTRLGPRGGRGLGYDNVDSYLNNTTFIDLLKTGLMGSRGTATTELERIVRESLDTGHTVMFGMPGSS